MGVQFPVFRRGDALGVLKYFSKVGRIAEAALMGDLGDLHIRMNQLLLGLGDPQLVAVIQNADAGIQLEQVAHVVPADSQISCNICNGDCNREQC